jgi:hypothetical protein
MLRAIRAYCLAQAARPRPQTPEAQARRRACEKAARAASELLAAPEESTSDILLISSFGL